MVTVYEYRDGHTNTSHHFDQVRLDEDSGAIAWIDLASPTAEEGRLLSDVFRFHDLAVEDALAPLHHPKIEAYAGYLYAILHGIDFEAAQHQFATHDVDFFVGPNYLVTIHDGASRSIPEIGSLCERNPRIVGEGPMALMHRLVDLMVDHYRPEVDKLEDKLDELEAEVLEGREGRLTTQRILELKRDVSSLRRVINPQRDALARLARREFSQVTEELAYRFRDVHDHVVRLADEAMFFQDRVTSILEAHLSNVSNRLNEVMKLLTIISTIFMPLAFVTGLYGMNVGFPHFPGGDGAQFWWLVGIMLTLSAGMLVLFHRKGWI
jgi:magnesium transporter